MMRDLHTVYVTISNFVHMKFSSRVLSEAVNTFSRLPGIGKKTASEDNVVPRPE